jgi:hypothetical protein
MAIMSMQKSVAYNQIPKDSVLLKRIKPLKKGEQVKYRVAGAYDSSQPDKFFGRTLVLPSTDVITDPETGEVYDIAYITGYAEGGIPQLGEIWFNDFEGSIKTLNGGNASDMKLYTYLELCNYLADNPSRDTSKSIHIEKVSPEKDRASRKNKFKQIAAAMIMIENMSETEVINFIRANRLPDAGDHLSRLSFLEDLAQREPEKFAAAPTIDPSSLGSIVDEALKAKVIFWNGVTREYSQSDKKKILTVKKGASVNPKQELEDFLFSPEGHDQLDWIKAELQK